MKILHSADIHLGSLAGDLSFDESGLLSRVKIGLDTLEYIIHYANHTDKCDVIVLAGDVFDVSSPSTRLLHEFNIRINKTRIPIILVLGQHELPKSKRGYHAFPIIEHSNPLLSIVSQPKAVEHNKQKFVCVPFSYQMLIENKWQFLNKYLIDNSTKDSVIIMHYPFSGTKLSTGYTLDDGLPKAVFNRVKYKIVMLGDNHTQQCLGQNIFYSGSAVYTSRSEIKPRGFYIHDLGRETHDFIEMDIKPLQELFKPIK